MPRLDIAPGESLHYEYEAPGAQRRTFVFVNALTGSTGTWQHPEIGPRLRAAGYGTLAWNFRGQAETTFAPATRLTPRLIVEDLVRVIERLQPPKPVLVGLSIGGLFAAQGILAGIDAAGLVLINTLRKPGARLQWINDAMVAMARAGGARLVMTANLPMLVNPDQLVAMRASVMTGERFVPMDPADGLLRLMEGSLETDWDFPWERLRLPVLVMTGLHDRVFRVEKDVAELAARIAKRREIVFSDAGHLIPAERPQKFAKALLEFGATL
ncbi:MAG: alpha/beta hydrolase [Burkholderiales bacterium]|nr:alpha/beta hydrolase [Burkholderiales bacterium]